MELTIKMYAIFFINETKSTTAFNYIQFWQKKEDDEDKTEDEESKVGFAEQKVVKEREEKLLEIRYKIFQVGKYFLQIKHCILY